MQLQLQLGQRLVGRRPSHTCHSQRRSGAHGRGASGAMAAHRHDTWRRGRGRRPRPLTEGPQRDAGRGRAGQRQRLAPGDVGRLGAARDRQGAPAPRAGRRRGPSAELHCVRRPMMGTDVHTTGPAGRRAGRVGVSGVQRVGRPERRTGIRADRWEGAELGCRLRSEILATPSANPQVPPSAPPVPFRQQPPAQATAPRGSAAACQPGSAGPGQPPPFRLPSAPHRELRTRNVLLKAAPGMASAMA